MQLIYIKKVVLADLVERLKAGQVLAMPTETVYGLIAAATNAQAVKKIYLLKGRNFNKPLPVICASFTMVKSFFYTPVILEKIAKKYWPGPLAIRFKARNNKLKVSKDKTIVARISSFSLLTELSKKLGCPLTATSANLAGQKECRSAREVLQQFKQRKFKPDLLIDGGRLPVVKPSTIIAWRKKKIIILRQGDIKIE